MMINESEDNGTTGDVTLPSDTELIRYLLECPVCSEYMTGQVRMCIMGHSICDNCFPTLFQSKSPCPLCRKPLTSGAARNFFVENLTALCKFKCKYADRGCEKETEGFMLNLHLQKCKFRDFKCDIFGIKEICPRNSLKYKDFVDHLLEDHEIPLIENGTWVEKQFYDSTILPSLALIKFEEKIFFYHTLPLHRRYWSIQGSHDLMFSRWVLQLDGNDESTLSISNKEMYHFEIITEYEEQFEDRIIWPNELSSFHNNPPPMDLQVRRGQAIPMSNFPRDEHKWTKEDENSLFSFSLKDSNTKLTWKEKVTISKHVS